MTKATGKARVFLFLQGPHGPFFARLAQRLEAVGATCLRVAFNAGDRAFWHRADTRLDFTGPIAAWPASAARLMRDHGVTDLVLYGDPRPIHAQAAAIARAEGITVHVFEEGYLRPHWITYERGGANGLSPVMRIPVADMEQALDRVPHRPAPPPDRWGDLRQHMFYGALYHWHVWCRNRAYPQFKPHRNISVRRECGLHLLRLAQLPRNILARWLATRRIRAGGYPYHVALLQLEHDASFQSFSRYASQVEFVEEVIAAFARGAPAHHHLVFKAHPLEDGRAPLTRTIRHCAQAFGLGDRVHYVRGNKLAYLIAQARSAVTVNSTAAHQALWRGIPVKVLGVSVYDKPGLVSDQALPDFFADPTPPDPDSYDIFRRYLLATSQIAGGYYARKARAAAVRVVIDRMLAPYGPYDAPPNPAASKSQQLRTAKG